jgi:hypothetical protein
MTAKAPRGYSIEPPNELERCQALALVTSSAPMGPRY